MDQASADDQGAGDFVEALNVAMACGVCAQPRCAVLMDRSLKGLDLYERFRCISTGRGFSRVWIGGDA